MTGERQTPWFAITRADDLFASWCASIDGRRLGPGQGVRLPRLHQRARRRGGVHLHPAAPRWSSSTGPSRRRACCATCCCPAIGIAILVPAVYTAFYPNPGPPNKWAPWVILALDGARRRVPVRPRCAGGSRSTSTTPSPTSARPFPPGCSPPSIPADRLGRRAANWPRLPRDHSLRSTRHRRRPAGAPAGRRSALHARPEARAGADGRARRARADRDRAQHRRRAARRRRSLQRGHGAGAIASTRPPARSRSGARRRDRSSSATSRRWSCTGPASPRSCPASRRSPTGSASASSAYTRGSWRSATATSQWPGGPPLPVAPMVGVIGCAPPSRVGSTADNGPHGGNLDVQEIGPGLPRLPAGRGRRRAVRARRLPRAPGRRRAVRDRRDRVPHAHDRAPEPRAAAAGDALAADRERNAISASSPARGRWRTPSASPRPSWWPGCRPTTA